jgi:hypothetical protein
VKYEDGAGLTHVEVTTADIHEAALEAYPMIAGRLKGSPADAMGLVYVAALALRGHGASRDQVERGIKVVLDMVDRDPRVQEAAVEALRRAQ